MGGTLLRYHRGQGSDYLMEVCPMCFLNADMRKKWVKGFSGSSKSICTGNQSSPLIGNKKHLNPESKSRGKVSGVFAFLTKWWGPFIRAPRWRGETLKMSTHPRTAPLLQPLTQAFSGWVQPLSVNRQMRISWSWVYRGPRGTKDRTFPESWGSKLKCPKKRFNLKCAEIKILL